MYSYFYRLEKFSYQVNKLNLLEIRPTMLEILLLFGFTENWLLVEEYYLHAWTGQKRIDLLQKSTLKEKSVPKIVNNFSF